MAKRNQVINGSVVSQDTPTENKPFNCGHCGGFYWFAPKTEHKCVCGVAICKPECKTVPLKCRNAYKAQELAAQGFSTADATAELWSILEIYGADVFDPSRTVQLRNGFGLTSYGGFQFQVTVEAV